MKFTTIIAPIFALMSVASAWERLPRVPFPVPNTFAPIPPPACLLACVAKTARGSAKAFGDFQYICAENGQATVNCFNSICPHGNQVLAVRYFSDLCAAKGAIVPANATATIISPPGIVTMPGLQISPGPLKSSQFSKTSSAPAHLSRRDDAPAGVAVVTAHQVVTVTQGQLQVQTVVINAKGETKNTPVMFDEVTFSDGSLSSIIQVTGTPSGTGALTITVDETSTLEGTTVTTNPADLTAGALSGESLHSSSQSVSTTFTHTVFAPVPTGNTVTDTSAATGTQEPLPPVSESKNIGPIIQESGNAAATLYAGMAGLLGMVWAFFFALA